MSMQNYGICKVFVKCTFNELIVIIQDLMNHENVNYYMRKFLVYILDNCFELS